ncbi:MAG: glycosyltransferase family 4 protein [Prochlorotrichaceae cyanobacterium]
MFTGLFPGFAKGFEEKLDITIVGERKVVAVSKSTKSYGNNFTYLSPSIVLHLFKFRPQFVFSSSFGLWTILALLTQFLGGWKVIIAYEGSSPGVDYRNSKFRLLLRRWMVKMSMACISNSQAGKQYLIDILHAHPQCVHAHPYEVPDVRSLDELNQSLTLVSENTNITFQDLPRPVFIFVGSIISRKGVNDLLEACYILQRQEIQNYSVLIVGDGDQRSELEALTQQYGLNDRIIWVGRVDYRDISTYFHHADVFVLPTLEDTWGLVILEALLLGKPVLVSTGAGASELVIDGVNGFCFPPHHPESLALRMSQCIQHSESLQEMGQRSKQNMEQYSPQAAATFMAEVVKVIHCEAKQ